MSKLGKKLIKSAQEGIDIVSGKAAPELTSLPTKGKLFATAAEDAAYETGYQNGESSGYADWIMVLTEEFDIGTTEINGPQDFQRLLREHYDIKPK